MKTVIAFDVSKGNSVIVAYDKNKEYIFESKINHTQEGFSLLQKKINYLLKTYGQTPEFVLESTGVYSNCIEHYLSELNYSYCVLNPLEASFQTKLLRRNKTDISDAHMLAKTHFSADRRPKYLQDRYYVEMRAMSRHYHDIELEKNVYNNRIHKLLQETFPEYEKIFKNKSIMFYRIIQEFPHAESLLKSSKTIVRNRLKKCTKKNYAIKKLEERAIQLREAANNSVPSVKENSFTCKQIRRNAKRVLELEEEQQLLIEEMALLSEDKTEYKILMSIPGIQKTTACRLIGELGDIRRFKSNKQVNAYVGIDIARYQSGNVHYKDHINKRGNKRLRGMLFFMIVSMLGTKKQNHIVEYYYKLKKQPYSKHHKVAIIACINKFLKFTHHLIIHEKFYDYGEATNTNQP